MNTVLIVLGCLIGLYILHRLLMNWQIDRSIDYMIENAEPYVQTPEDIERNNVFKMRYEKLKSKVYDTEDHLLFDLTTIHILNMIKDETDWTVNQEAFRVTERKSNKIKTRIKVSNPIMKDRVYEMNFTKNSPELIIENYESGSKMLDIFNSELDVI